ncbi:uncharacterized protein LOC117121983 [Anneissia japonica]|uniref:uncharacterized protein LOC117121983 n=1 Tax=Anneissia japonica TaxID=1529436 RepID=UPI00142598C8|nr:uncharacterized protein LOC117121983 [Anneissia japonica]
MYVFVTSNVPERISLCEVLVYSSTEEVSKDDLPLNPDGLWPLNSFYTIYDLSGFREYDASTTTFMFTNTSSGDVAFADLSPVDGMAASILIYNHGRFVSRTNFTLMFEIMPGPNSNGDIISIGDFKISQTNSGELVYSSEIEVTRNGTVCVRGVVFNSGTWTSIAVVGLNNGSTEKMSLWRNGYFVQARDNSPPQFHRSWNTLEIGFPGGASGSVRNVHYYSRALTQQELTAALTIPSEGKISRKIATSLISKMHSVGSDLFESAYSATFASGHVTKSVTVRSMQDCAFSCLDELLCNGYAFNKEHTQCLVGIGFVDKRDLVQSNDWHFYKYIQAV